MQNLGAGGNIGGTIFGPGVNVAWSGSTDAYWFGFTRFVPGSIWSGGGTTLFPDAILGTIGKQYYGQFYGGYAIIYASSFTFPTNGQSFTTILPASLSTMTLYPPCGGCPTFNLVTKPGKLTLSFFYDSSEGGAYQFTSGSFTTTPEPSSLALMAIGLGSLGWLMYKRNWVSAG